MALLAGAVCGVRNDSCSRKHKYARTSHGMASESLSRGVDRFFAQEFCFIKQEHGPPRGSKQAKTDVLLTTVLGPLRWSSAAASHAVRKSRVFARTCLQFKPISIYRLHSPTLEAPVPVKQVTAGMGGGAGTPRHA